MQPETSLQNFKNINNNVTLIMLLGGALSLISLTKRAPPLSNSFHTIYHVFFSYFYIVLLLSVDVLIICNVVL